ncbi:MAG: urate hydroxylase PuuD [Candidatus Neomarinimicrobiota bacterium]
MPSLDALFRWVHIVAGILWIGLLYWFNWVNLPFMATQDNETKQKITPELFPRALYWFRWGAAWTWVTGVLLLLIVFYHGGALFDSAETEWGLAAYVMIAVVLLSPFVYDVLYNTVLKKNGIVETIISLVIISAVIFLFERWAHFGYRGYVIHTGAMFGTIMAYNVWFRIWPAQLKIIPAIKNGEPPDMNLMGMAGMRSKHNTYMSVPLVWAMINFHTTTVGAGSRYILFAAIIIGWGVVYQLYQRAAKVQGF